MSCSLLFSKLGSFALFRSSGSLALFLKMARRPLSRNCSILQESLALQKCHTRWQYVRCGNIAVIKKHKFSICRNQVSKSHKDANFLTGFFTNRVNVL